MRVGQQASQGSGTDDPPFGVSVDAWRGRLTLVGGATVSAVVLLTAEIVIAHRVSGRGTGVAIALAWSAVTIGAWAAVSLPGLSAFEWIARRSLGLTGALIRHAGVAIALVLAAITVRALLDPLGPGPAHVDGSFAERWASIAIRWSGPGLLTAVVIGLAGYLRAVRSGGAGSRVTADNDDAAPPDVETDADAPLERLVVRVGTHSIPIDVAHVRWFEASGNYAVVHAPGRSAVARITMAELERRLDPARFLRVHRSAIVALSEIRVVRSPRGSGSTLVLSDGTNVPLSRLARRALESRLGQRV